ncbi:hypothetical protein HG535_0A00820 [Zygotorulaspora mrakii]|uniref:Plasma membrane fusion protein PRM1 n=1 Tax=Zygotorulaspora mrakii TaxID=42260 RepID=A0A7H9AVF5_ZYGMR|nr:uncharacterized protein HG535_0A00820 [Zygotorulaspora mrakii]QLG70143.1 hypothetical protein HG535_0A00820 [Zygotorulaspora mrakii]
MPYFTSYLRLNDRLSQVWINTYTLMLLIVMLKLVFFTKSIKDSINLAKNYTMSHCDDIDSLYSDALNGTPHYLGKMGNFLIEKTMIESVEATLKVISLLLYASEELLAFIVDLYIGTYVCLIVSAIDGTVDVATNTTEALIGMVNSSVISLSSELEGGLTDISDFLNKVISAASKVESFFKDDDNDSNNASDKISKLNLTISSLRDMKIPSSINNKLQELSNKTPDFADVKNMTKNLISLPFEKVRNEIASINSTGIVGDSDLFYVPPLTMNNGTTSGICRSNEAQIEKIYDAFGKTLQTVTVILIVLIMVGALAAMVPSAWKEYRQWKKLSALRDEYLEVHEKRNHLDPFDSFESEKSYDVIASYHRCFNVWSGRISNIIMRMFTSMSSEELNNSTKVKIQWVVSYMTTERALLLLGVGFLALMTCICQFIMIAVCRSFLNSKDITSLAGSSNSSFSTSLQNDMVQWSGNTNLYIGSTEDRMNSRVFGWINETTLSINTTANKMMDEIDTTIQNAFENTILYPPMSTIVKCTIGNKLTAIESAMTWIHNKAHFNLPRIDPLEIQALLLPEQNSTGSMNSTSSVNPQSDSVGKTKKPAVAVATAVQSLAENIRTGLLAVLESFYKTTMWELIVAFILIALWVIQLPIALSTIFCRTHRSTAPDA